jgi:DNA mismatch repair protein MutS2
VTTRAISPALPIPDLTCADAAARVDVGGLRDVLVFAFAAGASPESFDGALASAVIAPSTWRRAGFARDLYVDELVTKAFKVTIDGRSYPTNARYLARLVAEPPRDPRDVELRRAVLAELDGSPAARADLEAVYAMAVRLRTIFCAARQPAPRARRIEILRAARELVDRMATGFEGASSALTRVRDFGAAVVASDGYRRLAALLDHEDNQASLDMRVRVGADGEVRAIEIVGVRENRDNPFFRSWLRRLAVRFVLFLRGHRTTGEEVVERILSDVLTGIEDALVLSFQLVGDIELYLGALALRDRAAAAGLAMVLPTLVDTGEPLAIEGLFNPLLVLAGVPAKACDIRSGAGAIVIVTGPNSGGKTRLLQALGLAQCLAQAGLFAPARSARLPRASGLFASLFEEARADAPEGHLGMELLRIRRCFDELDPGALVVIDELCSGTNPSEGEEIARLVLSLLPEFGVRGFVTTHLLSFAAALANESAARTGPPALEFLQVELDPQERPTYRFVPGVARTSLAHKTAERLGVTRDELLARIAAKRRSG